MRAALESWVADTDTLRYISQFRLRLPAAPTTRARIGREDDLYLALVGELFDRLRDHDADPDEWSRLGNALADFAYFNEEGPDQAIPADTALFAATAFFLGGFSASAYLTMRSADSAGRAEGHLAAYELLARPATLHSTRVRDLIGAVREGQLDSITEEVEVAGRLATEALDEGPEEWVGWRLYQELVRRFASTNVRTVLSGEADGFWDPLVRSLLSRRPPVWDFFPSQIEAIARGLTAVDTTFSLQMPTGAGKTALTEALMFAHLTRRPEDAAILLVPYRALAAELRVSLVPRLRSMGIPARSAYGGTVPTGDELQGLDQLRALVSTPETLSGLLSADPGFFQSVSLVICDEGHLLDGGTRGVSLELLLARMKARETGSPRFVFVSAIVPNIEEINSWLGGTDETVVRSDYRPALAEFALLTSSGRGRAQKVTLRFHPNEDHAFDIQEFLSDDDFRYLNPTTARFNTYSFDSFKTQAVAAARKALPMGSVAVFAANKRGNQGCLGLARELLTQLEVPLPLPQPLRYSPPETEFALQAAVDYLTLEYGPNWIGTTALKAGAMVHHGDIPQETREVLERLMRDRIIGLAFCTSTLAEGVNLPLRTLVLYSVTRRLPDGTPVNLLARDIKNLVGRAGRPGSTTRGLVICANENQWEIIQPVAQQLPGEPVHGALLALMERLRNALARRGPTLTNAALESSPALFTLIDGVDSTLVDLAAEQIGQDELVRLAGELAAQTYAAREADDRTTDLMRQVFELRAERVAGIRAAGRLGWIRETGARPRLLDSVEHGLLPARDRWDDISEPTDPTLLEAILQWAWDQFRLERSIKDSARDAELSRAELTSLVCLWLEGKPPGEIASRTGLNIDDALAVLSHVVSYELQTAAEQGIALLGRFCEATGQQLAAAVIAFPEHLRFGVPDAASRIVASRVRHRRAAVALGRTDELAALVVNGADAVLLQARHLLDESWLPLLGRLVLDNTIEDLS